MICKLVRLINKDEIERFDKEEKALVTIILSVEPEQQGHIIDCETVYNDAWKVLEKVFEPKSRPRILQLKKQMVLLQLEPEESITSYLGRINMQ